MEEGKGRGNRGSLDYISSVRNGASPKDVLGKEIGTQTIL
jgi:hypothetical protein